jgi:hypothetical protein
MSDRKEFNSLVNEYQACLNSHYDKFLEGEVIQIDNICKEYLDKIKTYGNFYSEFLQEYKNEKAKLD